MPKPAKHVFVCSQNRPAGHPRGSCGQKGCAEVVDEFMRQWQQRQCFAQVMVTPSGCIGPCGMGPNVLVYPEGILYTGVSKADVGEIFDKHLLSSDRPAPSAAAMVKIKTARTFSKSQRRWRATC